MPCSGATVSGVVIGSGAAVRKIVHVDSERGFSGGERQVVLLVEGLARRGWENVVVCPLGSELGRVVAARGHGVEEVAMRGGLDPGAVRRLTALLRRHSPDLVHLHTGRAAWLGGLGARLAGVPAVVTRRMDRDLGRFSAVRFACAHLASAVAAISPAVERQLARAGVPAERLHLIPSSVDAAALAAGHRRPEVRKALGIGSSDVLVLAPAALVRRKGLDVLLEAAALLRTEQPRLRVAIAGAGPEEEALRARARPDVDAGRVLFLGRRDDMADLYAAADIVTLPSRREGLGVAALEAMAAGRPVVASRVGGLAWVVADGVTGLLVTPGDVGALARALASLATDPARRESMGQAGRRRAEALFSAEAMVEAYERLYRSVLRIGEK